MCEVSLPQGSILPRRRFATRSVSAGQMPFAALTNRAGHGTRASEARDRRPHGGRAGHRVRQVPGARAPRGRTAHTGVMATGEDLGRGPEWGDDGLPEIDVEIPDDLRELDRDVQAYR